VTFPGNAGDLTKAWLLLPHVSPPDHAFVTEYVGYGVGRGDPFGRLTWSCAGHPHSWTPRAGRRLARRHPASAGRPVGTT
jgi:cephalosporin-C deacetylase-like acetyl esterase